MVKINIETSIGFMDVLRQKGIKYSMHAWLVQNGYRLIADNKSWTAKRGDIVIFGKKE